jgi:hypothetical protein
MRMAGYANRESGHVESVAILWVRLPFRPLDTNVKGYSSNGKTLVLHAGDRGSIPRWSTLVF